MTAIERIEKISEDWFLTEPLLFVVYCSHELCENSEISVPMRTGNRKIEISPQILEKASDEMFYQINREAAVEIALQLRLRNLSGIIIVDFINMKSKELQKELLEKLRELVKCDKQLTRVIDMTPLGLVEITRKKGNKTLAEQFKNA